MNDVSVTNILFNLRKTFLWNRDVPERGSLGAESKPQHVSVLVLEKPLIPGVMLRSTLKTPVRHSDIF